MAKFPNFIPVEIGEGVTAKITPIRLGWDGAPEAIALLSEVVEEGNIFLAGKRMPIIMAALRRSLAENHSKAEVESLLNAVPMVYAVGSPLFCVCLALVGMDASATGADSAEADDDAEGE